MSLTERVLSLSLSRALALPLLSPFLSLPPPVPVHSAARRGRSGGGPERTSGEKTKEHRGRLPRRGRDSPQQKKRSRKKKKRQRHRAQLGPLRGGYAGIFFSCKKRGKGRHRHGKKRGEERQRQCGRFMVATQGLLLFCFVPKEQKKNQKKQNDNEETHTHTHTPHTHSHTPHTHTGVGRPRSLYLFVSQAQHIFFRPRTCNLSTPSTAYLFIHIFIARATNQRPPPYIYIYIRVCVCLCVLCVCVLCTCTYLHTCAHVQEKDKSRKDVGNVGYVRNVGYPLKSHRGGGIKVRGKPTWPTLAYIGLPSLYTLFRMPRFQPFIYFIKGTRYFGYSRYSRTKP